MRVAGGLADSRIASVLPRSRPRPALVNLESRGRRQGQDQHGPESQVRSLYGKSGPRPTFASCQPPSFFPHRPQQKADQDQRSGSPSRPLRLHNPVPDGILHELRAVVDVQLRHNVSAMNHHGLDAEEKQLGDLLVGLPLGHQS